MAELEFQDLLFVEEPDGSVKVFFLKNFYFVLGKEDVEGLGDAVFDRHKVKVGNEKRFNNLISAGFGRLKSALTDHDAFYIHQNSGVPLFGTLYFGIVDRGTNMLEVKPITGCNIDCVFCSVHEGKSSVKLIDYVVEKDYMLQELRRLLDYKIENGLDAGLDAGGEDGKDDKKIDVYINTHGEPLLYADIVELVAGIRDIQEVGLISVITNGLLLNEESVDRFADAGLTQLNVSLNSVDAEKAKELAGSHIYDVKRVKRVLAYAAKKLKVVIAPVYIRGVNDDQMSGLIEFAKDIGAEIGIQNYMRHKRGKKVAKELGWEEFFKELEKLEKEHDVKLVLPKHEVFATKQFDKPFKKGDSVEGEIVCQGRMRREVLAVVGYGESARMVSVLGCTKTSGRVKIKIVKDKDGVFAGQC